MTDKLSVLIPDAESGFSLFAMHCLAGIPNIRVHALSRHRWPSSRLSRYCHGFTYSPNLNVDIIANIIKKEKIDIILPIDTDGLAFVIANRTELSSFVAIVPLPDQRTFEITNSKWLLAQFLRDNGLPSPATCLVTFDELFERNLAEMEFPLLLKPITSRDGDGIQRFDNLLDLLHTMEILGEKHLSGRFILQRLLPGYVVGLNVLSDQGKLLAISMQRGLIPNKKKFAAASAITFIKDNDFLKTAYQFISGFFLSGFANVDALCDQDHNLQILDVNARFWGSLRGSLAAGISFPYLACLAGAGIPFPMPEYKPIRYFHPKAFNNGVMSGLLRKKYQISPPRIEESSLRFLLTDPMAEILRFINQEFLGQ